MNNSILFLFLICLAGCSSKMTDDGKLTPFEKKVVEAAQNNKKGQSGPVYLNHRKLGLEEIAEHLDMDVDTARLHLKEMNIYGYYSLVPHNLPQKGEFTLYHINYEGRVNSGKTFFINGNGILVTPLDDTFVDLSNNFLFFANYLPGEPADFVLASADGKLFASTHIVPNPIRIVENNRVINAEIASSDKRVYSITCSGFKPRSEYLMITRFENEKFVHSLETNARGEMSLTACPNSPFITGGDASIELKGEDLPHPLLLDFQWGAL